MKKENLLKLTSLLFFLYFGIHGCLRLDASSGNANLLTDLRTVGTLHGPEFQEITVHDIRYEWIGASDLPKEYRSADWSFVGYVTDGRNAMRVSSPGKWNDDPAPDYLRGMWGYDGYTYQRAEN